MTPGNALERALASLSDRHGTPVPIEELIGRYGVHIDYCEDKLAYQRCHDKSENTPGGRSQKSVARGGAGSEAEFVLSDVPRIRLYRSNPAAPLTPRERFSLAHELGHYIVWAVTRRMPEERNYWEHELLCNEFAANLLVPRNELTLRMAELSDTPKLFLPAKVNQLFSVSWEVAACAVTQQLGGRVVYLKITRDSRDQKSADDSRRNTFIVTFSSTVRDVGKMYGKGAKIHLGDFAETLVRLRDGQLGQAVIQHNIGSIQSAGTPAQVLNNNSTYLVALESLSPLY